MKIDRCCLCGPCTSLPSRRRSPSLGAAVVDVPAESDLFANLERRWRSLAVEPADLDDGLLGLLLADERRLRATGRWVAGPTTLLEVLRLQHDEVRNCRVVRWLLDPLAPHGFGAETLHLVLERANELAAEQGLEQREFPDSENATVIVEEARGSTRADIVINGPSWVVVVEAKIHAGEQYEQGQRLSDLWPGATYVYLTRGGDDMATAGDEPWIRMRWGDVLKAVRGAAQPATDGAPSTPDVERARRAVYDYLHAARRLAK